MAESRDFVYLDVERVRSCVAQAGGGVPMERTGSREHEVGGKTSIAGGIPLLARVEGHADYH